MNETEAGQDRLALISQNPDEFAIERNVAIHPGDAEFKLLRLFRKRRNYDIYFTLPFNTILLILDGGNGASSFENVKTGQRMIPKTGNSIPILQDPYREWQQNQDRAGQQEQCGTGTANGRNVSGRQGMNFWSRTK